MTTIQDQDRVLIGQKALYVDQDLSRGGIESLISKYCPDLSIENQQGVVEDCLRGMYDGITENEIRKGYRFAIGAACDRYCCGGEPGLKSFSYNNARAHRFLGKLSR